jgi:23S rRNA (cytosine1962-C5)-methyltransferase
MSSDGNYVILHRGKEVPIKNKHHWIYSGAIKYYPDNFKDGDICEVRTPGHEIIGTAYFNSKTSIAGRMLSFGKADPFESIENNISRAKELRKDLFDDSLTNCYRLINGEGDLIPGLVVDKYNDVLVIQISTLGLEKIKSRILELLIKNINPRMIYEKSNMPARSIEGLKSFEGILYGNGSTLVEVIENGIKFEIDLENSHKTGFYLDQREMRNLIGSMSKGKSVLNCFSYTGGFSLYAVKHGATQVNSVDISKEVIEQAARNFEINDIDPENHEFTAEDVFNYIQNHNELDYDIVILDPPAFAKKKEDYQAACSGYRKINRTALKKMKKGSYLLTCSCSYHVDEESFRRIIYQSALDANRSIQILQSHRHAMDHTINIFHPEMNYLKSFLLYVD